MLALRTGVTVRVDDTDVSLREGKGLLVFPFQFHDYMDARREALQWLFITFDMVNDGSLEALRYQPFDITPDMARIMAELVAVYLKTGAAALGISASHLRTRFRESCGVTIGKHVRRLRLEKARGLLRLSTRRVSEIAEMCGFSSVYTFSRAFHAAYSVAPLEYRKGAHIRPRKSARRR